MAIENIVEKEKKLGTLILSPPPHHDYRVN